MLTAVRAGWFRAPDIMMDVVAHPPRGVIDTAESAVAVARALEAMSTGQLVQLQALARLRARGLPSGVLWSDLLHEALVRALDGSRQWPTGVPLLVFLAGVMRSVCDEIWRRRRREAELIAFGSDDEIRSQDVPSPAADQERVFAASEALTALYRLFAGDALVLIILSGLANGLSSADIRTAHGVSEVDYDSARRRMRRAMLRAGLTWGTS